MTSQRTQSLIGRIECFLKHRDKQRDPTAINMITRTLNSHRSLARMLGVQRMPTLAGRQRKNARIALAAHASVKRKSRTLFQWLCHKVRVSNNSEAPNFLAHANPRKCSERSSNRDQIQSSPIQHLRYEHKKMLISTYATP